MYTHAFPTTECLEALSSPPPPPLITAAVTTTYYDSTTTAAHVLPSNTDLSPQSNHPTTLLNPLIISSGQSVIRPTRFSTIPISSQPPQGLHDIVVYINVCCRCYNGMVTMWMSKSLSM